MTLLIANIGTSDLAVKIHRPLKQLDLGAEGDRFTPEELEWDYFLPIGFDRNEPNVNESDLDAAESLLWFKRNDAIFKHLYPSWNVRTFRDFTESLLTQYRQSSDEWHDRIRPGRIWGVVKDAIARSVKDVYIFVTDQEECVGGQKNKGYDSDTVHLFALLKEWFDREFGGQLTLHPIEIPKAIAPVDLDGLFGEYYNFFKTLDPDEPILLSVKGGTPQMQTALRVQAISSEVTNQIYLEPQLSVKKILAGEASECDTVSYWRYQRVQKYQAVEKLLNRWDFDGAREILAGWSETLQQLESEGIAEVGESAGRIGAAVRALEVGIGYFNLDNDYAEKQVEGLDELEVLAGNYPGEETKRFPKLLNLYTQCCLLWETDRLADFLTRMGSFYEETLHELIDACEGAKYFDRPKERGDWYLKTKKLLQSNQTLAQRFYELEQASENWALPNAIRNSHLADAGGRWVRPLEGGRNRDLFRLPGRPTKLNFVRALVEIGGKTEQQSALQSMVEAMSALDYWCVKRNQLIHGAEGISKRRMSDVLNEDRQLVLDKQNDRSIWLDRDIENSIESAGMPDGSDGSGTTILAAMATICKSAIALMDATPPPSIFDRPADGYFDSFGEPHYLYSDIRDWVVQTLDGDR